MSTLVGAERGRGSTCSQEVNHQAAELARRGDGGHLLTPNCPGGTVVESHRCRKVSLRRLRQHPPLSAGACLYAAARDVDGLEKATLRRLLRELRAPRA
jgi:hypothetical protein